MSSTRSGTGARILYGAAALVVAGLAACGGSTVLDGGGPGGQSGATLDASDDAIADGGRVGDDGSTPTAPSDSGAPPDDGPTPPWEIDAGDDPDAACLGQVLANGRCLTTLASSQPSPAGIAIDAKNVYWTSTGASFDTGSVTQLARSGGAPVTLASGLREPRDITVDATTVYWSGSSVMAVPIDGGAPRTVYDDSNSTTQFVTRAGSKVYWASGNFDFGVFVANLDGSGAAKITTGETMIGGLAATSIGVVFTETTDTVGVAQNVVSLPLGGARTTIFTTQSTLGFVTSARGVVVYVSDFHSMYALPLAGGSPTMLATTTYASALVTDGTFVYWTDANLRAVMKVGLASGAPEVLVSYEDDHGITGSGAITIDAKSVFFTEPAGRILKLTPR